jgi:hypothetical protein
MVDHIDGTASLAARRTYLRRRRLGRLGVGGGVAGWTGLFAIVLWLLAAALTGLIH